MNYFIFLCTLSQSSQQFYWLKAQYYFAKNVLFNFIFQHEGQLYANWLFYIFTFYYKGFLFQLFSRAIHMHITILTWFKMVALPIPKWLHFAKNLKLNFEVGSHLYVNCCFYILFFHGKSFPFQFLSLRTRKDRSILTGFQKGHIGG